MITTYKHRNLLVLGIAMASSLACRPKAPTPDGPYADPAALAALLADPSKQAERDYLVVDVRTPGEYAQGHLPTAVNIPVDRVAGELVPPGPDAPLIFYCKRGVRSARATEIARKKGFVNTTNFGGLDRWSGHMDKATPERSR